MPGSGAFLACAVIQKRVIKQLRDGDTDMAEDREGKGEVQGTRRGLIQGAGVATAMALLGGLTGGMITPAQAADASPFPDHKRWKIVFVNHVTTNPFFVPTQYGIQDACALLVTRTRLREVPLVEGVLDVTDRPAARLILAG